MVNISKIADSVIVHLKKGAEALNPFSVNPILRDLQADVVDVAQKTKPPLKDILLESFKYSRELFKRPDDSIKAIISSVHHLDGEQFVHASYNALAKNMGLERVPELTKVADDFIPNGMTFLPTQYRVLFAERSLKLSKPQLFGGVRHELEHVFQLNQAIKVEGLAVIKVLAEKRAKEVNSLFETEAFTNPIWKTEQAKPFVDGYKNAIEQGKAKEFLEELYNADVAFFNNTFTELYKPILDNPIKNEAELCVKRNLSESFLKNLLQEQKLSSNKELFDYYFATWIEFLANFREKQYEKFYKKCMKSFD